MTTTAHEGIAQMRGTNKLLKARLAATFPHFATASLPDIIAAALSVVSVEHIEEILCSEVERASVVPAKMEASIPGTLDSVLTKQLEHDSGLKRARKTLAKKHARTTPVIAQDGTMRRNKGRPAIGEVPIYVGSRQEQIETLAALREGQPLPSERRNHHIEDTLLLAQTKAKAVSAPGYTQQTWRAEDLMVVGALDPIVRDVQHFLAVEGLDDGPEEEPEEADIRALPANERDEHIADAFAKK